MNRSATFVQAVWLAVLMGVPVAGPAVARAFAEGETPAAKPSGIRGTGTSSNGEDNPAGKSPLDDELIRSLKKAASDATADADRLERAIQGMRDASKRMESADPGKETQALQARVVEDLEQLLKQLQQQQKQKQKQNSSQNQQQQDRQKLQQQQLDPKNSGSRQPQPSQPDAASQQRRNDPARDAQENVTAAQRARDEEARREQMVKDVWGHLPPHLREAMMQSFKEKYLPQYEDLVRRYYEALAEKNKPRAPSR